MEKCTEEGCPAEFPDHRWGRIRAADDGWFFQRTGERWCPVHVPSWVPAWRAEQGVARAKPKSSVLLAECLGCGESITKPFGEGQTWAHADTGAVDCSGSS